MIMKFIHFPRILYAYVMQEIFFFKNELQALQKRLR